MIEKHKDKCRMAGALNEGREKGEKEEEVTTGIALYVSWHYLERRSTFPVQ